MGNRDTMRLIKNIYDEETVDAIKSLDQNLQALMHHNAPFKQIQVLLYTRVPIKPGSQETHIRMDVSRGTEKASLFLTEDFMQKLNESHEIRGQLLHVMNRITLLFKA